MREILFKAKRLDNGEWVEGYPVKYGFTGKEKWHIIPSYASDLYAFEVNPDTICQYTGLTDKNGNKIFEGDIICIPFELDAEPWETKNIYYENGRVYFDDKYHGWYVKFFDDALSIWEYDEIDVEVIGNIFDNPELLENK